MGEKAVNGTSSDALASELIDGLVDDAIDGEAQVIGHFEVGPPGVGPVADVTTGEFYPSLGTPE